MKAQLTDTRVRLAAVSAGLEAAKPDEGPINGHALPSAVSATPMLAADTANPKALRRDYPNHTYRQGSEDK